MTEEKLTNIIKNKLSYFEEYKTILKEDSKNIDLKKKDLVKKLMDDPDSEDIQAEVEYLFYDANMKIQDVNQLAEELAGLYKISNKEDFTEEEKVILEGLKENARKQSFVVANNKLEERVKGLRDKHVSNIKKSPHYKQIINSITQNLK